MKNYREITLLYAEDDDGHALLIKDGLERSGVQYKMIRFSDGEEIWQFLSQVGSISRNKGYLILLDIHMPRVDGVEILEKVKNSEELKAIPVMMLTTTDDPREIERCYRLGCSAYITKPVDFRQFEETLQRLGQFIQIMRL